MIKNIRPYKFNKIDNGFVYEQYDFIDELKYGKIREIYHHLEPNMFSLDDDEDEYEKSVFQAFKSNVNTGELLFGYDEGVYYIGEYLNIYKNNQYNTITIKIIESFLGDFTLYNELLNKYRRKYKIIKLL